MWLLFFYYPHIWSQIKQALVQDSKLEVRETKYYQTKVITARKAMIVTFQAQKPLVLLYIFHCEKEPAVFVSRRWREKVFPTSQSHVSISCSTLISSLTVGSGNVSPSIPPFLLVVTTMTNTAFLWRGRPTRTRSLVTKASSLVG